jgi:naphtho-gamma-pyrone polyketide synthase
MEPQISSAPFMPPLESSSTTCQVFLLGDLTLQFEEELRQILHIKGNENLHSFFNRVSFALRKEFGKLPNHQQDLFPRFTTLVDLLSKLGETKGTPILRFFFLSVCEIAQFIRYETINRNTALSEN